MGFTRTHGQGLLEHHYLIVKLKCDNHILEVNGSSGFCLVSKNLTNTVSNWNHHLVSSIKAKEEIFCVKKCMYIYRISICINYFLNKHQRTDSNRTKSLGNVSNHTLEVGQPPKLASSIALWSAKGLKLFSISCFTSHNTLLCHQLAPYMVPRRLRRLQGSHPDMIISR